jgi:ABC-type branched-subunit amino acid transport system substrate-binding protein
MARLAVEFIREDPAFNETIDFSVDFADDRGDLTQSFINALDAVQNNQYKVILGPNRSAQSQLVSAVGAAFKVPLVSYASSSPTLSSKNDYAYFFRTCPSDNQQAQVWVSLMKQYDWKQCAVLASNDAYGSGVSSDFLNLAQAEGISVNTVSFFAPSDTDMAPALEAVRQSRAKIVILAAIAGGGGRIAMKQAVLANLMGPESGYTWIVAEGSASSALLLSSDTEGETALSNVDFRRALLGNLGTKPRGGAGPLWNALIDRWQNGNLNDTLYPGAPSLDVVSNDVYVPYSVDAVYTIAHAFRKMAERNISLTGDHLRTLLSETDFEGVTGNVQFDSNYDRSVPYSVLNIRDTSKFFEGVGEWSRVTPDAEASLVISGEVIWPDGTTKVPGDGLPRDLYWIHWSHAAAIVILVLVALMILVCIITAVFVAKFSDTPVMRLASPFFLVVTLVGLAVFFSSLVPWFGEPTLVPCSLRNWLGHMGFCVAMAAIIAKTYRVDVIFRRRKKIKRIIVTNLELFKYMAIAVAPMLILMIIWTIIDRPKPKRVVDVDKNRINVVCGSKTPAWLIAAFVYDAFLMCLSLFLSFRTRRVPDGFNETWYIYLSGYNTAVMGILGVTLGYVLNKNLLAVTIIVSITLLVGGVGIWVLLFLPKLYIALLKPEQNNSSLKSNRTTRGTTSPSIHHNSAELAAWHSAPGSPHSGVEESSKYSSDPYYRSKDGTTGTNGTNDTDPEQTPVNSSQAASKNDPTEVSVPVPMPAETTPAKPKKARKPKPSPTPAASDDAVRPTKRKHKVVDSTAGEIHDTAPGAGNDEPGAS